MKNSSGTSPRSDEPATATTQPLSSSTNLIETPMLTGSPAAADAFSTHSLIVESESRRRKILMNIIQLLSIMEEGKKYRIILGDPKGTWAQYLADNDIYLSRNEVYQYIRVYRTLTGNFGIPQEKYEDISSHRLYQLIKVASMTTVEDWFTKARTLTTYDWKIELRKARGLLTEDDEHEHDDEAFHVCRKCGNKRRVETKERVPEGGQTDLF